VDANVLSASLVRSAALSQSASSESLPALSLSQSLTDCQQPTFENNQTTTTQRRRRRRQSNERLRSFVRSFVCLLCCSLSSRSCSSLHLLLMPSSFVRSFVRSFIPSCCRLQCCNWSKGWCIVDWLLRLLPRVTLLCWVVALECRMHASCSLRSTIETFCRGLRGSSLALHCSVRTQYSLACCCVVACGVGRVRHAPTIPEKGTRHCLN